MELQVFYKYEKLITLLIGLDLAAILESYRIIKHVHIKPFGIQNYNVYFERFVVANEFIST